jgi:DNA polymerase I
VTQIDEFLFDIETDGLLDVCTVVWIIHIICLKTGQTQEWLIDDEGWVDVFSKAKKVVGHNIIGFDLLALKKLKNFELPKNCKVIDTLILSQALNYRRFGSDGHSLGRWGEALGQPKQEHEDWSQLSPEMITRCRSDCSLNLRVYLILKQELLKISAKSANIVTYLDAEHYVGKWCATAELNGWPFDVEGALILQGRLEEVINIALVALNDKLGTKTVAVDKVKGIVETKTPKWTQRGCYDLHTANWFNVDPWSGYEGEERMIEGEYCRVTFEPLQLSSVTDVKIFLFRNGWVPLEWNYKMDEKTRKKVKTSPKITEESLEFLGGDGEIYSRYAVAKSRLSILKTWLNNVDSNGRLHGRCMPIGTPSLRATHEIIVNVPKPDKKGKSWGKEMRALFTHSPGWINIGCDSSGNQARGLAHFLGDAEFIKVLLNDDIHQHNADIMTDVLRKMGVKGIVDREQAKRIYYAVLFGASGPKLWSYIFGIFDESKGKKFKTLFLKSVPGFATLMEKLENIFGSTRQFGDGYIPSIAGCRVYVDSFHKLLVYLLQSTEKATCATAVMLLMKELEEKSIPYEPLIMMHDETQFQVPLEYAEQAAEIGRRAFREGPKLLGVTIMDGESKIGNNWYETH